MFELMRPMRAKIDAKIKEVVFGANWLGDESDDDATAQTKAKSKTKERGGRVAPVEIDEAHYLQPFGMMSFPVITKTTRMFSFFDGPHALVAWVWDSAKAIVDLVSGETRLFSVGKITVRIRLKSDGSLSIESDGGNIAITATGGDVVLNGGTLRLARETDAVSVSIPINALTLAVTGATATGPAAPLTLTGTISAGGAANARG